MELREAIDVITKFLEAGKYGYVRVNCQGPSPGEITNVNVYETHKGTALDHRKPSTTIGADGERKKPDA